MMKCKCATFDSDSARWQCSVSGDGCVYLIPDSIRCANEYGEGPDGKEHEHETIFANQASERTVTIMNRKEILETAIETICNDREEQYGSPKDNFNKIAAMWWLYCGDGTEFSAADVAMMMALVKVGRIATGVPKADNFIDAAGYLALAGEIMTGNECDE